MGGTPSEGLYTAVFRGRRENLVYVDVYTYNLCSKRKSDETTSSASDNTYQLGVSVLDVPSVSNTVKNGGNYCLPDDLPLRRSGLSDLT
jgi:hypothetical protein